jgi:hypothetical protein
LGYDADGRNSTEATRALLAQRLGSVWDAELLCDFLGP